MIIYVIYLLEFRDSEETW